MNKAIYIQGITLIILIFIVGCETTSNPNSSLNAVDHGLSNIEGAVPKNTDVATTIGINQIGLVDILVHRLDVSPQQALGGAGAIFQVAQGKMDPQIFADLHKSIPGMSAMLGAAAAIPRQNSLSSITGGSGRKLENAAELTASFQQLNLSPDMIERFILIVTRYVRQSSGQTTADHIQSALTDSTLR